MKIQKKKAEKFASSLRYSQEGLLPVVVLDSKSRELLMLAYADKEAIVRTLSSGDAYFFSRSRKSLWKKGETSGNTMKLISLAADCDNDTLAYLVQVQGKGQACHLKRKRCFLQKFGPTKNRLTLAELADVIESRIRSNSRSSYTVKLSKSRKLACSKIEEESGELVEALQKKNRKEVIWEACDLIYHTLVAVRAEGVMLGELEEELARRNGMNRKKIL